MSSEKNCPVDRQERLYAVLRDAAAESGCATGEITTVLGLLYCEWLRIVAEHKNVESVESVWHGVWAKELVAGRIREIPNVLDMLDAWKRKFRIVLEYDPESGKASVELHGVPAATLPPNTGSRQETPGR